MAPQITETCIQSSDDNMHSHSRVFNPLWDQKIPHELLELSLKVVQSELQAGIYSQLPGLPFVEGLDKFPPSLSGDMCWDGRTDTLDYLVGLSLKDIHDIEVALYKFKGTS
ncbi:hypothetical protein E8E11_002162 [Didymella keratinophila]|nr:hypothetical protein E8E11_002162 [Didymella keratinophila]